MTDPRLIEIGTFPVVNGEIFVVGDDFADKMVKAANRKADDERAEAERQRQAQAADAERAMRTRKARAARQLRRALRICLR
jgi:hypothetical protein